eukprot:1159235-Pelagomonas_calceolata.AAC.10
MPSQKSPIDNHTHLHSVFRNFATLLCRLVPDHSLQPHAPALHAPHFHTAINCSVTLLCGLVPYHSLQSPAPALHAPHFHAAINRPCEDAVVGAVIGHRHDSSCVALADALDCFSGLLQLVKLVDAYALVIPAMHKGSMCTLEQRSGTTSQGLSGSLFSSSSRTVNRRQAAKETGCEGDTTRRSFMTSVFASMISCG